MSWKEEKAPKIGKGMLEWRGGVQLLGKGGWYDICIIGKDGNKRKEIDKSACPKAVRTPIGLGAFPTCLKPLVLSYI
jgi:hypothetical protein